MKKNKTKTDINARIADADADAIKADADAIKADADATTDAIKTFFLSLDKGLNLDYEIIQKGHLNFYLNELGFLLCTDGRRQKLNNAKRQNLFNSIMAELKKDTEKNKGFFLGFESRFFYNLITDYKTELNKSFGLGINAKPTQTDLNRLNKLLNNSDVVKKRFEYSFNIDYS